MRLTRIWTDGAGDSHFDEVEVELVHAAYAPPAPPFDVSPPRPAEGVVLFEMPPGWRGDWHPTPRRQLYCGLRGELEVAVSDGEVRRLPAGSLVLLEDLEGRGHLTRVVGETTAAGLFVHLAANG
jgi:quercetin dioxygenase-like cupin family protein